MDGDYDYEDHGGEEEKYLEEGRSSILKKEFNSSEFSRKRQTKSVNFDPKPREIPHDLGPHDSPIKVITHELHNKRSMTPAAADYEDTSENESKLFSMHNKRDIPFI